MSKKNKAITMFHKKQRFYGNQSDLAINLAGAGRNFVIAGKTKTEGDGSTEDIETVQGGGGMSGGFPGGDKSAIKKESSLYNMYRTIQNLKFELLEKLNDTTMKKEDLIPFVQESIRLANDFIAQHLINPDPNFVIINAALSDYLHDLELILNDLNDPNFIMTAGESYAFVNAKIRRKREGYYLRRTGRDNKNGDGIFHELPVMQAQDPVSKNLLENRQRKELLEKKVTEIKNEISRLLELETIETIPQLVEQLRLATQEITNLNNEFIAQIQPSIPLPAQGNVVLNAMDYVEDIIDRIKNSTTISIFNQDQLQKLLEDLPGSVLSSDRSTIQAFISEAITIFNRIQIINAGIQNSNAEDPVQKALNHIIQDIKYANENYIDVQSYKKNIEKLKDKLKTIEETLVVKITQKTRVGVFTRSKQTALMTKYRALLEQATNLSLKMRETNEKIPAQSRWDIIVNAAILVSTAAAAQLAEAGIANSALLAQAFNVVKTIPGFVAPQLAFASGAGGAIFGGAFYFGAKAMKSFYDSFQNKANKTFKELQDIGKTLFKNDKFSDAFNNFKMEVSKSWEAFKKGDLLTLSNNIDGYATNLQNIAKDFDDLEKEIVVNYEDGADSTFIAIISDLRQKLSKVITFISNQIIDLKTALNDADKKWNILKDFVSSFKSGKLKILNFDPNYQIIPLESANDAFMQILKLFGIDPIKNSINIFADEKDETSEFSVGFGDLQTIFKSATQLDANAFDSVSNALISKFRNIINTYDKNRYVKYTIKEIKQLINDYIEGKDIENYNESWVVNYVQFYFIQSVRVMKKLLENFGIGLFFDIKENAKPLEIINIIRHAAEEAIFYETPKTIKYKTHPDGKTEVDYKDISDRISSSLNSVLEELKNEKFITVDFTDDIQKLFNKLLNPI